MRGGGFQGGNAEGPTQSQGDNSEGQSPREQCQGAESKKPSPRDNLSNQITGPVFKQLPPDLHLLLLLLLLLLLARMRQDYSKSKARPQWCKEMLGHGGQRTGHGQGPGEGHHVGGMCAFQTSLP